MSEPTIGRKQWTCPYCRKRFALRATESEEQFAERCNAHRGSRHCGAEALARRLLREERLERLIDREGQFLFGHDALKEAGLIQEYRTRLAEPDYVRAEPWAPGWAVDYEAHLRVQRRRPYRERVAELRAAAETPEATERVRVFLVLVDDQGAA